MKMTKESLLKIISAADEVISALAGTNDEVHKDDNDKMIRLWDDLNDRYAPPEVVRELARMALGAMDSEPVAYTDERNLGYIDRGRETAYLWGKQNSEAGDVPLYRHAQPTPERDQVRREHADLSEWADMQFLLWDAQRRAGITDEQITQAMTEKLAVNKQREWPEPKDGEPRLHIKEQPAPVVSTDLLHTAASAIEDLLTTKDRAGAGVWFDLPFRLRSAANAQPAPVVVPNGLRLALSNAGIAAPESDEMLAATCEKHIQALVAWVRNRKPFQSAPVVPEEANPDSIEILASARRRDHAVFQWDEDQRNAAADSWNACRAAMLAAATQEV